MNTSKPITQEQAADNDYIKCLIDGAAGIYVPQKFINSFENWDNIDNDDRRSVANGPDNEYYWESWQNILDNATHTDDNGNKWVLYQDDSLFVIRADIEIDWDQ